MLKEIHYENDNLTDWDEFEHDTEGRMTKRTGYNADGSMAYWDEFEYDAEGNSKRTSYNADGTIWNE